MSESMNVAAKKIADEMVQNAEKLKVIPSTLSNGTCVIDCGVNAKGSIKGGELFTKVCLGGICDVGISIPGDLSDIMAMPAVKVKTDFPALTTLGSQKAGWKININGYYAIGSGPGQTHKFKDSEIYKITNYVEESDIAVITLEADTLPNEDIAQYIADECDVKTENLTILVAPTASLVGSIQISGRALETGIYKMHEILDFDITKITYAAGITPITPVDPDSLKAMGKTNDAIIFGGRAYYYIEPAEGENLEELATNLPSSASEKYGQSFIELFEEAGRDFYKMPKDIFAPAQIIVNDMVTGQMFHTGYIDLERLKESFEVKEIINKK
ncbi:methenyltetrahydromethanopterin cyclohydrolase [Methanosphaera sp. WGK6]|uniref:methenyltetrahydromethanopterin cyclohydrolase n=1 Tax=Methanosphaera sp. WGK6 TaxID=1561964 RepID=UPI00084C551B|nr:methenyltetrahydromethanopterin cyclohydrolase [Methanosphaera sp. WGK6]OED30691.1 N(5),N(10)-methenyltetrahydromethanopterin cyclohydrolase [Methanosphaera sp. WGK6]